MVLIGTKIFHPASKDYFFGPFWVWAAFYFVGRLTIASSTARRPFVFYFSPSTHVILSAGQEGGHYHAVDVLGACWMRSRSAARRPGPGYIYRECTGSTPVHRAVARDAQLMPRVPAPATHEGAAQQRRARWQRGQWQHERQRHGKRR